MACGRKGVGVEEETSHVGGGIGSERYQRGTYRRGAVASDVVCGGTGRKGGGIGSDR